MSTYWLTLNSAQAVDWSHRYHQEKLAQGEIAWAAPQCMAFQAWLKKQWYVCLDAGLSVPLLLSEHGQRQIVWQVLTRLVPYPQDKSAWVQLTLEAMRWVKQAKCRLNEKDFSEYNRYWLTWYAEIEKIYSEKKYCDCC